MSLPGKHTQAPSLAPLLHTYRGRWIVVALSCSQILDTYIHDTSISSFFALFSLSFFVFFFLACTHFGARTSFCFQVKCLVNGSSLTPSKCICDNYFSVSFAPGLNIQHFSFPGLTRSLLFKTSKLLTYFLTAAFLFSLSFSSVTISSNVYPGTV